MSFRIVYCGIKCITQTNAILITVLSVNNLHQNFLLVYLMLQQIMKEWNIFNNDSKDSGLLNSLSPESEVFLWFKTTAIHIILITRF